MNRRRGCSAGCAGGTLSTGARPPYPTLWEACVNAIVFQQVSLVAASTIMGRLMTGLSELVERDGIRL